jgi:CRISPR-associated protein (TIGR03984 family)
MTAPTTTSANSVAGCDIDSIDMKTCATYLEWLHGEPGAGTPEQAKDLVWALAHCDDGVTWGWFDKRESIWRLGSHAAPEVSPPIREQTLQELRLFGETGEVLIWRTEEGLHGRVLCDLALPTDRVDKADPLRPSDEARILRGDSVRGGGEHGFTRVVDRTGAEQVVPAKVLSEQLRKRRVRLHVRHYWEQDPESGAVRIAVTRLVKLTTEGNDGY